MLQALAIQPHETVLEIGTGSGYVTALLAKLARHVYSVELQADFLVHATNKLREHRIANVTLEQGDAAQRWELCSPYDVIAITGSVPVLPEHLTDTQCGWSIIRHCGRCTRHGSDVYYTCRSI